MGHENIGIAYANRSEVFMKQGFFKVALENILNRSWKNWLNENKNARCGVMRP
jgi:hypothetical protein